MPPRPRQEPRARRRLSWPIRVESTSPTRSRFSRPASGCTIRSNGSSAKACSSAVRFAVDLAGKHEVRGDAVVEPAPALDAAQGGGRLVEGCLAEPLPGRIGDQRCDKDDRRHEPSGRVSRAKDVESRASHCRPDGERQVRGGFGAGEGVRRDDRRRRFPCRSTPTCSVLTARPTPNEEASAPHRLFGEIDGAVTVFGGLMVAQGAGDFSPGSARSRSFSSAAPGFISGP